ncbi:MAG: hypothetical protein IT355_16605 [Gemmatimonadaceae bacterium]|nr:hypothetical protein [Gemmatimonadaceae bacterium]
MTRRSVLVASCTMCVATVAFPCGVSNSFDVDGPLVSAATFGERGMLPLRDLDFISRDEVRLLPGFLRADSARFAGLIGRAPLQPYAWDTTVRVRVPEPTGAAIVAAWGKGDAQRALREAGLVVAQVMALPVSDDAGRDSLLRRAVETIELAPAVLAAPQAMRTAAFERLAAPIRALPIDSMPALLARSPQSPRRATLEYAALRLAVRHGLPDGTREEIAKAVPAARWDSLHAAHRAWLARYPQHPYAGLVQFSRMRLFFLASQADSTWDTAVALYGEYPVRAAAEMRYLLTTFMPAPPRLLSDARVPIEVRAALVGNLHPGRAAWESLMQAAVANRGAPWSENLEERLLAMLATDSVAPLRLPQSMPSWRATASPFWRHMWAVSMLRAGRLDEAARFAGGPLVTVAQDSLLAPESAYLAARIHMTRGDWASAATTPGLDQWTRRYIVRVLAPDSAVSRIGAVADRVVSREARLVLAVRAANAGRWTEAAAQVQAFDAARAARYTRLGTLAGDTGSDAGLLRYATALAAGGGTVFYEQSRYFYRGMMNRDYTLYPRYVEEHPPVWDLPWTRSHERARMFASLREGSERWLALRAFVSYLARPGVTAAQRRAAVRAADRTYRALLDTDPSRNDSGYWADSLPRSAEAQAIRRAGRR